MRQMLFWVLSHLKPLGKVDIVNYFFTVKKIPTRKKLDEIFDHDQDSAILNK